MLHETDAVNQRLHDRLQDLLDGRLVDGLGCRLHHTLEQRPVEVRAKSAAQRVEISRKVRNELLPRGRLHEKEAPPLLARKHSQEAFARELLDLGLPRPLDEGRCRELRHQIDNGGGLGWIAKLCPQLVRHAFIL